MPDLSGRTAVVTGASSGLGEVTARELARAGARVVLAVRNRPKGEQAASTMPGTTEVRTLDVSDLASVRAFAAAWAGELEILINNAGIMAVPETRTGDGFEPHLGTNYLEPFALTNLLLPHLTGGVITVSSIYHARGRINLADLNYERRPYRAAQAYNDSKLADLMFTLELQRRLTAAGSPVRSLAAHPGLSRTSLLSHSNGFQAGCSAASARTPARAHCRGWRPGHPTPARRTAARGSRCPPGRLPVPGPARHPAAVQPPRRWWCRVPGPR
jgi:NAD(P)-dependent dehydrogenase (short-subunit alcohol dehydrogenase family)